MKMTETAMPAAPMQRHMFRASCRQFAPPAWAPRPAAPSNADASPPTAADPTAGLAAASSPTRRSEADLRRPAGAADIAPDDWDLLFCVALDLLARVAVEKATPGGTGGRLQAPGTVLRECIDALHQLRRSAPHNSIQPMCRSACTGGETSLILPAPASGLLIADLPQLPPTQRSR